MDKREGLPILSIRVKPQLAENFRDKSSAEGLSQGEFLEKLLDTYSTKASEYRILVTPREGEKKILKFQGSLVYQLGYGSGRNFVTNSHRELIEELLSQKGMSIESDDLIIFSLYLYVMNENNKFLIHESLSLGKYGDSFKQSKLHFFEYEVVSNVEELIDRTSEKLFPNELSDILYIVLNEEGMQN